MGHFKIATLLIAATILSACAVDTSTRLAGSASRTLSLGAADPEGVLIVGKPRRYRDVHVLVFHSYDPASNLLISPEMGGKVFKLNGGGTLVDIVDEVDDVQYLLQKLPAGQYYLVMVYWGPSGRTLLQNGSIAVDIKPGSVTYVGNLSFKLPILIFGDVEISSIGRNDAVARSILAKYPGIRPVMENISPKLFKLNCPLEDGLKVCYAP